MIPDLIVSKCPRWGKPRASGDDPAQTGNGTHRRAVNPARAGMIPATIASTAAQWGKPRASGDDPAPTYGEFGYVT